MAYKTFDPRRIYIIFAVIIITAYIFRHNVFLKSQNFEHEGEVRKTTPSLSLPSTQFGDLLTYNGSAYRGVFYILATGSHISLVPNFTENVSSDEVYRSHNCSALVNGNFYTSEKVPLGLFVTEGKTWAPQRQSATFNGFLWQSEGDFGMDFIPSESTYDWIMQTGPVLMVGGEPLVLQIRDDEPARRMVSGLTEEGKLVLMSFISDGNTFSGPLLSELPALVEALSKKKNLGVVWALNHDGGSASAYISPDVTLSELTQVGSFLCVKS